MSLLTQEPRAAGRQPGTPRIVPDLRRHRRVPVALNGRFMREDRKEYTCQVKDISVGGAGLACDVPVEVNERIIAYFDHLGGLEAVVTRVYRDGFAVQFKVSAHKREKLAAQITWLINRDAYPEVASRAHERFGTGGRKARLRTNENITVDVDVLDISVSGASVGTAARPPIGSSVMLGDFRAVVRRHHDQGLGVQFEEMHDIEVLRRSLL
ncbi:MAG: PilZ domain-containing protein [Hyphomicrobiaceae bacterium]|nr:PilZ domain-containing protein [Hyphomicrobiaceae bacterium]